MPTTVAALNILLFLLPGFVTERIVEGLTVGRKQVDLTRVIDALVFALLNYSLYSGLALIFELQAIPFSIDRLQFTTGSVSSIATLTSVACLFGFLYAKSLNDGWHYRFLRWLRITHATGRVDVWYDVFTEFQRTWVRVHLKDGGFIVGWPHYYSDDPKKRELFLGDARVMNADGITYDVKGPGILLTDEAVIERIEVLSAMEVDSDGR